MSRTYKIEPHGKKFATVCRTDGYWSITYLSKNTRLAKRKGDEFVSGERTAMRKYRTAYGRRIDDRMNQEKRQARKIAIMSPNNAALMALLISQHLKEPK